LDILREVGEELNVSILGPLILDLLKTMVERKVTSRYSEKPPYVTVATGSPSFKLELAKPSPIPAISPTACADPTKFNSFKFISFKIYFQNN
jgi:hypothetical protein